MADRVGHITNASANQSLIPFERGALAVVALTQPHADVVDL